MMKNKLIAFLSCILVICNILCASPAMAQSDAADDVSGLIGGIAAFRESQCGAENVQEWIDNGLAAEAGVSAELYILALHQLGEVYDYSAYSRALFDYMWSNNISNAVTRQKFALGLMSANCRSEYVSQTVDNTAGQLGVMSWVYGLHLLNNGAPSASFTAEQVVDNLLGLRLEDGGWAISGDVSDVDVTAMTLQALVPYKDNDNVSEAVDGAVTLLSQRQLESGGYASYGVENAESSAQVIIALSALGIDCRTDQRFIKNGISPLDSLVSYRLEDGSFAHDVQGTYSAMATSQAFCALTALERMQNGLGSLYILDPQPDNTVEYIPDVTESTEEDNSGSGRLWACVIILALAAGVSVLLWLRGKRSMKNYAVVLAVAAAALVLTFTLDVQKPEDYYGTAAEKSDPVGTVTITITCDAIPEEQRTGHIPSDGIILKTTELPIEQGETVYDILTQAAREYSLHLETDGGELAYVRGLGYIYEFDFGELSGWMYRVNSATPSVGCAEYVLSDGDVIEWFYTLDMK